MQNSNGVSLLNQQTQINYRLGQQRNRGNLHVAKTEYLIERVLDIEDTQRRLTEKKGNQQEMEIENDNKNNGIEFIVVTNEEEREFNGRYFVLTEQKCFNCDEIGHQRYNCPQLLACPNCLSSHSRRECEQINHSCFICGSHEHQKINCNKLREKRCYRCGWATHETNKCFYLVLDDDTEDRDY